MNDGQRRRLRFLLVFCSTSKEQKQGYPTHGE